MSGTVTRGSIPRLLVEGVKNTFGDEIKKWDEIYPMLYEMDKSKKAYEVAVQMEGFGLASQKNEGDDITFDSRRQGFAPKYVHTAFAKGFVATREALDDELYGVFKQGAKALGRSMKVTKEVRAAILYNTAFSSSSAMTGGDGVSMCSTAHINGPSGGTYANRLAVDADFSEASLEDMLKIVMRSKDARGLAIRLNALKLIGHTDNQFNFQRVLNSTLQNDTANNATNAVKDLGSVKNGFICSPYLDANPQSWFLRTDAPNGMKGYNRVGLEFDQDTAFTSDNRRFKAYERYSFGYDDPRGIFGSEGQ